MKAIRVVALILLFPVLSCGASDALNLTTDFSSIPTGMPDRSGEVDLSSVVGSFLVHGGPAFILLTSRPTAAAIEVLGLAGLTAPPGRDRSSPAGSFGFRPETPLRFRASR